MLSELHRKQWLARGFSEDHLDAIARDSILRSLSKEEVQRDWMEWFPKMAGVNGGALLLTFNDSTQSLRPDDPLAEKYLYRITKEGAAKGTNTQPWVPSGDPLIATEGLADALVATFIMGVPCCGVTAPSHLKHSELPASVKVYINDADVPFHHSEGFLAMVVETCRLKKLKIAHVPRNPCANYAYGGGKIPDDCKWGMEEANREWLAQGLDPAEELNRIVAAAQDPVGYVRSIIDEFRVVGIRYPSNAEQIRNLAKAIAAASRGRTKREPLVELLAEVTKAKVRWINDEIRLWDDRREERALASTDVDVKPGDGIEAPCSLRANPKKSELQSFLRDVYTLRLNEVTGHIEINGQPTVDLELFDQFLSDMHGIETSPTTARGAAEYLAKSNPYNPIAEYLQGLRQSDVTLVPMHELAGAFAIPPNDTLSQELLARHLVAHIERAEAPGTDKAKHDQILVLIGDQGTRKSSALKALAPPGLYDSATAVTNLEDRDFLPKLNSCWVFEFDECELMLRMRSAQEFKGFVSRLVDRYTPKYKSQSVDFSRRAILWGTSNNSEVLNDHTGNRRVWIISTGARMLNPEWIASNRDSIWATVMTWRNWGLTPYLPAGSTTAKLAAERAQEATLSDPLEQQVRSAIESNPVYLKMGVAQEDILRRHLGLDLSQRIRDAQMRVTRIVTGSGFRTHDGAYRWEQHKGRYPDFNGVDWQKTSSTRSGYVAVPCSDPVPTDSPKVGTPQMPWQNRDLKKPYQLPNHLQADISET